MNLKKFQAKGKRKNRQIPFQFDKFLTVRVISHGPISLKVVVVLLGDTLLKFQYIGKIHKILEKFTKYWKNS